jgi:hypothetical protein
MILLIYLLGAILCLVYSIKKLREENIMHLKDLIFLIPFSMFSWIGLVVVYISFNEKQK